MFADRVLAHQETWDHGESKYSGCRIARHLQLMILVPFDVSKLTILKEVKHKGRDAR